MFVVDCRVELLPHVRVEVVLPHIVENLVAVKAAKEDSEAVNARSKKDRRLPLRRVRIRVNVDLMPPVGVQREDPHVF